jgi:biotin transport system substrate-specific component
MPKPENQAVIDNLQKSKQQKSTTFQLALIGVVAAFLCIIGPFAIPIGPVPITLATFGILLAGYVLGPKYGPLAVAVYLLLGFVGLPVFSGGIGGIGKLVGPTGGYLLGWLAQAFILGLFVKQFEGKIPLHVVGAIIASIIQYAIGTVWFVVVTATPFLSALLICVVPFLIGDSIKLAAAIAVGAVLRTKLTFLP